MGNLYLILYLTFSNMISMKFNQVTLIDVLNLTFIAHLIFRERKITINIRPLIIIILAVALLSFSWIIGSLYTSNEFIPEQFTFFWVFFVRILPFAIIISFTISHIDIERVISVISYLFFTITLIGIFLYINNAQILFANNEWIYEYGELHLRRFKGFSSDTNFFLISSIIPTAYFLKRYLESESTLKKVLYLTILIIILISWILTFSRSALILFMVNLFYGLVIVRCSKASIIKNLIIIFVLITILYSLFYPYISVYICKYYLRLSYYMQVNKIKPEKRILMWEKAFLKINKNPFGYGYKSSLIIQGMYLHNSYIEIILDGGVIMLFYYLALVIYTLRGLKTINYILYYAFVVDLILMTFFSYEYSTYTWMFILISSIYKKTDAYSMSNRISKTAIE